MKKIALALLLLAAPAFGQSPTQIKQIIPTTTSVVFNWVYNTTDEVNIDAFVLQRTAFAATSTITSPYSVEQVISQKTARSITYTIPTGLVAGQTAFFRMIARKTGLVDSPASNVVQIQVLATPPAPTSLSIQ